MQHRDRCYKCSAGLPRDFWKPGAAGSLKGNLHFNEPEREGLRVDAEIPVQILSSDFPNPIAGRVRNFSRSGMQVRSETAFRTGSSLTVRFQPHESLPDTTGEVRYSRAIIDEQGRTFVTGLKVQNMPRELLQSKAA
jgi:hypothetical protein